jgi:CRISPR-associated protein Cmr6
MSNYQYLVPKPTQRILEQKHGACLNLELILARYLPREIIDDRSRQGPWLRDTVGHFDQTRMKPHLQAYYGRWQAMIGDAHTFTGRLQGRLVVGLGGKGPLEFGLTLQHVTGLPIIPGSALKGMTRAYGLLVIAADLATQHGTPSFLSDGEGKALAALDQALAAQSRTPRDLPDARLAADHLNLSMEALCELLDAHADAEHFRRAFGSNDAGGVCVFYDAVVSGMAAGRPLFEVDVMTPHFREYYEDVNSKSPKFNKPPHDGDSPNPVNFLTVAQGTRFAFAVGL